jgi:uncharacterized protein YqeY
MSIVEQMKATALDARKSKNEMAKFHVTLLGEVQKVGKDIRNGETTDEEAIKVVRKFLAGAEQMAEAYSKKNDIEKLEEVNKEIVMLKAYLPTMMDEKQLEAAISGIISNGANNIGAIMKELKAQYAGLYDGGLANKIIKQLL